MIVADAPGKIILFGEHFVVKGVPALAMAINLRARVVFNITNNNCLVLDSRIIGRYELCGHSERIERKGDLLKPYLTIIDNEYNRHHNGLYIVIDSQIPIGAGLGSSGATSIALSGGIVFLNKGCVDKTTVYGLAMKAESIFHSKPSGIDPRTSLEGGLILYRDQKRFDKLSYRIPSDIDFLIVNSGIPRKTSLAVTKVLNRYERQKKIMQKIYEAAEELIIEALNTLKHGDYTALGELMLINQGLLNAIGVSYPVGEKIIKMAIDSGALGAKITGAGLGGYILILVEKEKEKKVAKKIEEEGFKDIIKVNYDHRGLHVVSES